jgi:hypothetical protein
MKKILLLVVLSVILFGCSSVPVPTEFDPTETPFEGEWCNFDPDFNKLIYTFTGNRWEFTYQDLHLTGLFNYNDKDIIFSNENGKWTQGYVFLGSYSFFIPQRSTGRVQTGFGQFIKQPYGDLVVSYISKEKLLSDIITNEEELSRIQGSWKHTNPIAKGATYTFSGDQFSFNVPGSKPISGTAKIKDNILYLIVFDDQFGIKYLDILPNNKIYLNELCSTIDLFRGEFIKQ